ncbi:hypothetical protein NZK35_06275 [Stieleria sp. ICT_E10.1]|uniref:hypothetical protein n=1 Tax=Stieleria sedimenti TaxID=2976331 RepID=UPI00217F9704|nr:hypothetical protein [Stieleria sedimenti]MCS7466280.1 hypothetical protein [Stieleria sedimenti]
MTWIPSLVLAVLSAVGVLLLMRQEVIRDPVLARKLGVIGAMSAGAFSTWLIASVIRSCVVLSLSPSASFFDFVFGPVLLYGLEVWFLLAGLLIEAKTSLGGRYRLENEWRPSFVDGVGTGVVVSVMCTILFFPMWWMIRPGDYGKFNGSLAGVLVSDRVSETFEPSGVVRTASLLATIEQRKAIPHSIALATLSLLLIPIGFRLLRFTRRELDGEYEHTYKRDVPDSDPYSLPFPPRGGGLN